MDKHKINDCAACGKSIKVPILDYVNGKFFLRCPHCRSFNGWMAESIEEADENWNKFNRGFEEYDDEDYPFEAR